MCFFRASTKACAGVAQEQKALAKRRGKAEEANCVRYAGEKWEMKLSRQENMSRVVTFFMMAHPSMINDLHVCCVR